MKAKIMTQAINYTGQLMLKEYMGQATVIIHAFEAASKWTRSLSKSSSSGNFSASSYEEKKTI